LRRWEHNNRTDFKIIDVSTRNWVDAAQDRDYLRAHECGIEPSGFIDHGIIIITIITSI
jgi:hypothetical protein